MKLEKSRWEEGAALRLLFRRKTERRRAAPLPGVCSRSLRSLAFCVLAFFISPAPGHSLCLREFGVSFSPGKKIVVVVLFCVVVSKEGRGGGSQAAGGAKPAPSEE